MNKSFVGFKMTILRFFLLFFLSSWHIKVMCQEYHDGILSSSNVVNISDERNKASADFIHFYQKNISKLRGSRCAMYPTCSNYGLKAFKKENFAKAFLDTADRLIRCGHDGKFYSVTYAYGNPCLLDLPDCDSALFLSLTQKSQNSIYTDRLKVVNKKDSLNDFIRYLINNHDYNLAMLEIERLSYFDKENSPSTYLQKLICYEGLERMEEGIFDFYAQKDLNICNDNRVKFQVSKMFYRLNNYSEAEKLFSKINLTEQDSIRRRHLYLGLSNLKMGYLDNCVQHFEAANQFNTNEQIVNKTNEVISSIIARKPKSKVLAGILSIFPGGGYWYAGHKSSAITSFIVNSLLGFATYTSIKSRNYGVAGIMGLLNIGFYFGNISGAIKSVQRANESFINDKQKALEQINGIY
ncbi:membrane protein insertion efficiency factor YidD [Prevotella disiens]|uniref:membrane protein insertion efficiency factor YidD n=1 Tax=Prevotella disiens TaxID=28130 RepID=UPI00336A2332